MWNMYESDEVDEKYYRIMKQREAKRIADEKAEEEKQERQRRMDDYFNMELF